MDKIYEECFGCKRGYTICKVIKITPFVEDLICPCSICIIKGICTHLCELIFNYRIANVNHKRKIIAREESEGVFN